MSFIMKRSFLVFIAGLCVITAFACQSFAADLSVKAQSGIFGSGYPTARCGMYYGIGTGGSAGQVNDAAVGTRIVQGQLDAILGYSCPIGAAGFWFVEGSVGFDNINGTANGVALSGPLVLMQRAGAGSPINTLIPNPFGNNLALPAIPVLPNGVTLGAAQGYFFAGLVEQDVAQQVAPGVHNHVWLVAPMIGFGALNRLNGNAAVLDVWAGWQMNSQSFCSVGNACARLGNTARVGVSFKF